MKKVYIAILFVFIIAAVGCSVLMNNGDSKISTQSSVISSGSYELALIYNPFATTIHPKVFVKKNNVTDVDLYVLINDAELLFSKATEKNKSTASVKIFYKIMSSYEKTELIDSSVKILKFNHNSEPKTYAIKIKLKSVELDKFVVQTTVTDMLRGKMSIHFSEVDKTNPFSEDNFMVVKTDNMQPLNTRYIKKDETIKVEYLAPSQYPYLIRGYKELDHTIPLSPYSSDPAVEDTTILYETTMESTGFALTGNKTRLYSFTADTTLSQNYVIPCFDGDFPNINTPVDMAAPLAYLTTPEEYDQIINSEYKKLAVDDFWYSCTHDIKKAKQLIKVFYMRAVYSNILFTDYRQGIFTDRGMVYTVLGPPHMLAITSNSEIWTYIDSKNGQKVKFVFRRTKTKLCYDKYVLRRSTEHKPYWDKAVQTWRKGNIFTF